MCGGLLPVFNHKVAFSVLNNMEAFFCNNQTTNILLRTGQENEWDFLAEMDQLLHTSALWKGRFLQGNPKDRDKDFLKCGILTQKFGEVCRILC